MLTDALFRQTATLLLLLSLASPVFADGEESGRIPTPDEVCETTELPTVESIAFEGLTRTREIVLRRAVSLSPGESWSEEKREQTRREVRSLGLFDRVEVLPETEGAVNPEVEVVVRVRERWTLVPIPFFTTTSGGTSGGLFVLENNLFGFNKQLVTGGAYGTAGFNGIFIYNDPAILGSSFFGGTALSVGRSEEEVFGLDGERQGRWETLGTNASLRLGYRLSQRIDLSTSLAYRRDEFATEAVAPGADRREEAIYSRAALAYGVDDPQRYFNAGYRAEIEGEQELTGDEWSLLLTLEHDFPLFDEHRLGYALAAEESRREIWRATSLGGRQTQRTIDSGSLPAQRYLTGGLSYEFPVYRPDWGTVTLFGFYEGGLIEDEGSYHGPGGGFRLYVSRVTLPAVGFNVGYRVPDDQWLFSFSIGMSM